MVRTPGDDVVRLLLVEDNPGDARLLQAHLSDAPLLEQQQRHVRTLGEALDRLRNGAAPPDVVLLDLGLPDAGGLEAVKAVVEAAPELPVIVLTGRDDRRTAVEALREGAEDYLLKGEVGPDVLARSIRYALERKRAQRELAAERARLAEVFENAPAWMATLRGADHVFEMANPAFRELVENRQVVGRTVRDVLPELEGTEYFDLLDHVYETGETVEVEERALRLETAEGTEVKYVSSVHQPRREDGEVVGVIAHGVDVTEQVERRREAEEQQEKLDRVLKTAADGVLLADGEGRFTYANPAAEEMLGLEASEITGRSYDDTEWKIVGPDGQPVPDEELPVARVIRAREPLKGVEFSVERPDGTRRFVSGHHAPLEGPDGELQGVVVSLRDITEIREARLALEEAKEMFQGVFEISPVGLTIVDAETQEYRTVNEVFTEQFGYTREEGEVRDRDLWPDPEMRSQVYGRVVEGGTVRNVEVRLRRKEGSTFDALFSASSLVVEGKRYVVGAIKDISYQKEVERELKHRALHDELTGLPNRTLLDDRLRHALDRCERTGESLAVCFVDLKRFKVINDSLGHEAGDRVLEGVAERLVAAVREQDTVARVGGDEFAVLLENVEAEAGALAAADRILETFEEPIPLGGREVALEASLGIAVHRAAADGERPAPTDLLRWADEAMYRAKTRPGTARALADPDHPAPDTSRIEREARFRTALKEGALGTAYQPIVDVRDGALRGVEVLCRWHDPELGEVSPRTFIPLAEETGLIVELGEQQLEATCRSLQSEDALSGGDVSPLDLHVNLSSRQLEDPDVVDRVRAVLERTGFPAGRLCLEVTESAAAQEPEAVDRLGELGAKLALDDFGTRYSTLAQLKRLRVDALKIDRSFVAGLGADDRDRAIVESVITLGHALGLTVVAEGVESAGQLEVLRELGADEAQGFHLARPMPLGELREWMEARS